MKTLGQMFSILILMALIIGCSDDDNNPIIPLDSASIRVLHASPDAPNVDVLVDNQVVLSDVSYKQASDFLSALVGTRNVKVNAAGTSTSVIDADLTLAFNSFTTIIATNFLAQIEPLVLPDENTPPSGNLLKIRVVHSAPSAPPVDVYVTAPGEDINAATPTLSDVAFLGFSDFLEVPEGDYQIRVTAAGSKVPVFDSGPVTLDAGSIFTAVAVDATGGASPISLVVLTNDPTTPFIEIDDNRARLRAVHASPDAGIVDILVDNVIVASDVAFKGVLGYTDVPAGDRNIKVNTDPVTSVIDETVPLAGGTDYTVLAVDFAANIEPLLLDDNTTRPTPGNAKVRVVHGSPSAPATVDVYVTVPGLDISTTTPTLSDVAFKGISAFLEVPEGNYQIRLTKVGSDNPIYDSGEISLVAGSILTVVAVDATGGGLPVSLIVLTNDPANPFVEIPDIL